MSPFEYISVLISIILGLGITILLTGFAELIRRWSKVVLFIPYLIWILLVFILHLQEWWETYSLRDRESWSLLLFLFVISYPIILFILANLFYPHQWPEDKIDLKEYYFENCRKFFALVLTLSLISLLQNYFLSGIPIYEQIVQFAVFVLFFLLLIFPSRNLLLHSIVAIVLALTLIISFTFNPEELQLK
ncbi:MAG: hypothetical protein L0Y35_05940 [Flammeovirgaceae bacterium]|nr:hypothetical protein [Flammeovirgaceae bacterium]